MGNIQEVEDNFADAAENVTVLSVSLLTGGGPAIRVVGWAGRGARDGLVRGYHWTLETQRRRMITAAGLRVFSNAMNVVDDIAMGGRYIPNVPPSALVQPVRLTAPKPTILLKPGKP